MTGNVSDSVSIEAIVDSLLQACAEPGLGERSYRGIHGRFLVGRLQSGRPDTYLPNFNSLGGIQGLRYAADAGAAMHSIDAQYELRHDAPPVGLMIRALYRCNPVRS
jgi:hypothetical protein